MLVSVVTGLQVHRFLMLVSVLYVGIFLSRPFLPGPYTSMIFSSELFGSKKFFFFSFTFFIGDTKPLIPNFLLYIIPRTD